MATLKGELVVLTPLKQDPDHYIVRIQREESAKAENVLLIAGGQHTGLIVNKLDKKPNFEYHSDLSLSFNVLLTGKDQKQYQEKRTLFMKYRKNVKDEIGKAVAHKFFRSLIANMPGDYSSFMKRAMALLHKEFEEIVSLVIDYKILDEEEKVVIPDAAQYDSGSEVEEVTAGHVQEVLEHAFPNGLELWRVAECLRCGEDEALAFLKELETSGIARRVDDEWIRVDTTKVNESVNSRRVSSSQASSSSEQPTVAIISCLFVEKQAIDALIEESATVHKYKSGGDSNVYTIGRIGQHRVVATKLALIGDSREAITSAGSITTRLLGNFQNIEHVFIVGVGGAVPHFTDASLHARLGDVIISASRPHQYTYAYELLFDRQTELITGFGVRNWNATDNTIEKIVVDGGEELIADWNSSTEEAINLLTETAGSADVEWKSPPESTDVLAMPISRGNVVVMPHPNVNRKGSEIHLGNVGAMASMKKYESVGNNEESLSQLRESFAESFNIRCMDAGFDSVVGAIVGSCISSWALIRGVSDYQHGQSRAGKLWQAHAAVRAAGITRCIIERIPPSK